MPQSLMQHGTLLATLKIEDKNKPTKNELQTKNQVTFSLHPYWCLLKWFEIKLRGQETINDFPLYP